VVVTEVDPIARCRPSWTVTRWRRSRTCGHSDIFVTTTGNKDVITAEHMKQMKHQAIVGNIGHFDNEIDMAGLMKVDGIERVNVKPQVDKWVFPRTCGDHSSEGRLLNLGNARASDFVMSNSFTNQTMAQMERSTTPATTRTGSTCFPNTSTKRWPGFTSKPWECG